MNLPNQLVCLSKQWIERFSYSVQIGSCSGYGKCRYKLWENKQTKRKDNKSIASLRPARLPPIWIENVLMGCRDGAVVRAFASHQWPGFDSQIRRQMWVEFVGSLLCTERFPPGTPVSALLKRPPFDLICVNC